MTKTLTLEGDLTDVDTETQLTTQGSVSEPSRKIPEGVSRIDRIIVGVAPDMGVSGAATFFIRLGGVAVIGGEQVITVAAAGGQTPQAGADPTGIAPILVELDNLDIQVKSDVINVSAEMAGSDLGTARIVVTLVFS